MKKEIIYMVEGSFPKKRFTDENEAIEYAESMDHGEPEQDIAVFEEIYKDDCIYSSECVYDIYRELPEREEYDV